MSSIPKSCSHQLQESKGEKHTGLQKINVYLYIHAFEALDIPFLCHLSFPNTVPLDLKHVLKCYHPLRFQDVSEATKGLL